MHVSTSPQRWIAKRRQRVTERHPSRVGESNCAIGGKIAVVLDGDHPWPKGLRELGEDPEVGAVEVVDDGRRS
jgi:hypothetical protein